MENTCSGENITTNIPLFEDENRELEAAEVQLDDFTDPKVILPIYIDECGGDERGIEGAEVCVFGGMGTRT